MSRGPFLADLTDFLFFHGTQVLTRGCSIKRVLNSPSANESSQLQSRLSGMYIDLRILITPQGCTDVNLI